MGAGLGMGSMLKGGNAGLNDIRRIKEHDENRQMKKEDRQAGLNEREHLQKRRTITEERQDKKYEQDEGLQKFDQNFNEGVRTFGMTGDASGLADAYNKYYPDGGNVSFTRKVDEKGNDVYSISGTDADGNEINKEGLTKEQIGMAAMSLKNPQKWLEMQQRNKAGADATKSSNKHEMDKIDRKAMHDKKLASVKAVSGGKWKSVTIMNPDFSESVALFNDKTGKWKDEETGKEIEIPLDQALEMAGKAWDGRDPLGPNWLRTDAMKEALDGKKSEEEWKQAYAMKLVGMSSGKNSAQSDTKASKDNTDAAAIKNDPAKLHKYLSEKYKDKASNAQIIQQVKKLHPKWEPSKPKKAGLEENS